MTELSNEQIRLGQYETRALVQPRIFTPGTYTQKLYAEGNSLLSSVFVRSLDIGATVQVNYYDTTTGEEAGERNDLASHPLINTAPRGNRITVPRIHNKPVLELVVTGGNATLGVYVSVVASFVTDLDQALKFDEQVVHLESDKGMPMMLYDDSVGKFFFLRGDGGAIPITISESGDHLHLVGSDTTTPGDPIDLIDNTVPPGKTRKLTQAIVTCAHPGVYYVTADDAIIGSGRTGPAAKKDIFTWNPRSIHGENVVLKVTFTALTGTPPTAVEAYLMGSDI